MKGIKGMEEFFRRSKLTGKKYNVFDPDIVRIINMQQVAYYISQDVMPLDVYVSQDKKDENKRILVYLYDKKDTVEVFDRWCRRDTD